MGCVFLYAERKGTSFARSRNYEAWLGNELLRAKNICSGDAAAVKATNSKAPGIEDFIPSLGMLCGA
jgi:hypothetical protein